MRKTIVILVGIAALVAGAFLFVGRTTDPLNAQAADSNDAVEQNSLIATFESLDEQRRGAFEARDIDLLRRIYTDQSPALQKVIRSVRSLIQDGVRPDERVRNEQLRVLSMTSKTARLRQEMFYDLRFFDASNTDVTKGGGEEQQVIEWVLKREGDEWRLHAARLVEVR